MRIVLNLPMPPSQNRIWRVNRKAKGKRKPVYRSKEYLDWIGLTDRLVMALKQYPKQKITGKFMAGFYFNRKLLSGDVDNLVKVILDYCQSRDMIRNDSDCEGYLCLKVDSGQAPEGCRVVLTPLSLSNPG